ncbi:MAG: phosphoenolpyruvate carboxykinase [Hyphomicrobiales bacterium]|nr:MAG: phosphoenolpyruvate carboxykinase [Hyphomicrobiales bacterium]
MTLYTTAREFQIETEEKKSRFIAFLVPSSCFESRLDELRKEHRKASHHVTAFRKIMEDGRVEESAKDDGEPAGTSGMPILKVMQGENLIDCGVIVVRYFGGTKLGTGGLARAYSKAAKHVIEEADKAVWHKWVSRTVNCGFDAMSAIEKQVSDFGLTVTHRDFSDKGAELTFEGPEMAVNSVSE